MIATQCIWRKKKLVKHSFVSQVWVHWVLWSHFVTIWQDFILSPPDLHWVLCSHTWVQNSLFALCNNLTRFLFVTPDLHRKLLGSYLIVDFMLIYYNDTLPWGGPGGPTNGNDIPMKLLKNPYFKLNISFFPFSFYYELWH